MSTGEPTTDTPDDGGPDDETPDADGLEADETASGEPDAGALNDFNQQLIDEFRANDGEVSGPFEGAPLLLLTTVGARSGRPHTTPVVYTRDGERLVVIASKGGSPTNPAWFHNLVANPIVTVELGGEPEQRRAVVVDDDERARLYLAQAEAMPAFHEYQEKTERIIPVVALEPLGDDET